MIELRLHRKLRRVVIDTPMTKGQDHVDQGQDYYEQQHRQRVVENPQKKAQQMGFVPMPIDVAAS